LGLEERIVRRLSVGRADPIVVADFQSLSLAPRLSEMLSQHVAHRPVFQIDPIGVLTGARLYISLPELATACVDELLSCAAEAGHVVVIGHCSAAALSLRVADLLAATGPVTALLVEPAWPDDELVTAKFAEYLTKFTTTTHPCPDLNQDPHHIISAIHQLFHDELTALATHRNLTTSMGAFTDLLLWYRAWLAFLLACRNDTPTEHTTTHTTTKAKAAVTVLTGSPATLTLKGLNQNTYQTHHLPTPQPPGPPTPELAQLIATHIRTH